MPGQHDVDQHDVGHVLARTARRPPRPMPAPSTVQPSSSRASFTASRMRSSSSTARIRVPTAPMMPERRSDPVTSGCGQPDSRGEATLAARSKMRRRRRRAARPAPAARRRKSPLRQPASRAISSPAARSHGCRPVLEVGVEAAGGDVAQVERRRRRGGGCRGRRPIRPATTPACSSPALGVVAEPGGDERRGRGRRGRCSGSARRCSVAPPPAGGGEQLAERRDVHGAGEHPVGVAGGDRRRPQPGRS